MVMASTAGETMELQGIFYVHPTRRCYRWPSPEEARQEQAAAAVQRAAALGNTALRCLILRDAVPLATLPLLGSALQSLTRLTVLQLDMPPAAA
jgi:hypothetical protein